MERALKKLMQKPYKDRDPVAMAEKMVDLENRSIIMKVISFGASPCFLVPKPGNKGWRFVCDFKRLNQFNVQVGYPMALLKDLLQRSSGCRIITIVDMKDGFSNLMVDENQFCHQ